MSRGLSIRAAGELCGRSDSYISQIENGRMNVPSGLTLERLLATYGGIPIDTFYERAHRHREKLTEKSEIIELLEKTNEIEAQIFLKIVKAIIA